MGKLGDFLRSLFSPAARPSASADPRAAGRALRQRFLETPAAELGLRPDSEFPRVFGVALDWPAGEETATLLALRDGSASLCTTSAFGIPGGGQHEPVRAAARRFVREADSLLDEGLPAGRFEYPPADAAYFYLCSYGGVRVVAAELEAVQAGTGRHAALFAAGQEVVSALRATLPPA